MPKFEANDVSSSMSFLKGVITRKVRDIKNREASFVRDAANELGLSVDNVILGNGKIVVSVKGDQDKIDILRSIMVDKHYEIVSH